MSQIARRIVAASLLIVPAVAQQPAKAGAKRPNVQVLKELPESQLFLVMNLVSEVEVVLVDLTRLTGRVEGAADEQMDSSRGHGPAIPGVDHGAAVVNGQEDIDALLSDLGM